MVGRLTPNWAGGLGGNAWLSELQNVMKKLGFNYGSLSGAGATGAGGKTPNMWDFVAQATGGGGGTSPAINPRLTDVTAAINAAKPAIYEEQTKGFGNAAKRFGQTGMLASSPYMAALGDVSRKSTNDIASLIENLTFQANESAAQRGLTGDIATMNDQTSRDLANRSRLMDAARLAWDTSQSGDANALAAAQLLGDWYMRMREGDENRTLSYAGMEGSGGSGSGNRAPSYIPAPTDGTREDVMRRRGGRMPGEGLATSWVGTERSRIDELREEVEKKRLADQLRGPQRKTEEELLAEQLRKQQLRNEIWKGQYTPTQAPDQGIPPALFTWLSDMGFDESMIQAIRANPNMLEYFISKYHQRGV